MGSVQKEPVVADVGVGINKVIEDSGEAAVYGVFWNGVAAFFDADLDTGPGFVRVGKPEEVEDDAETILFGLLKILCVCLTTEGGENI